MKGFRTAICECFQKYIGRLRKGTGITEHATAVLIGADFLARSGSAVLIGFLVVAMIYTIVKEDA